MPHSNPDRSTVEILPRDPCPRQVLPANCAGGTDRPLEPDLSRGGLVREVGMTGVANFSGDCRSGGSIREVPLGEMRPGSRKGEVVATPPGRAPAAREVKALLRGNAARGDT
jgi:hypothetical protein